MEYLISRKAKVKSENALIVSLRGCLNFACRINQIDFLGEFVAKKRKPYPTFSRRGDFSPLSSREGLGGVRLIS